MRKIMKNINTKIVATIGPASSDREVLTSMINNNLSIARLNFSWDKLGSRDAVINLLRELSISLNKQVFILVDLPGPRIQQDKTHTYDKNHLSAITEEDKVFIDFAVKNNIDYIAVSFVKNKDDILLAKEIVKSLDGNQKIIAKIETKEALENLDEIINEADGVMIARGDLIQDIPFEKLPSVQKNIIKKCIIKNKMVIVATEMMLSMQNNILPTRAEITDVFNAVLDGASHLMLSEETAIGKHPALVLENMSKIIKEAENYIDTNLSL